MQKVRFSLDSFPWIVIASCIALYIATLLFDRQHIGIDGNWMYFLSPSAESVFVFGATGALPVFSLGRWWTVFSAAWLHGSFFHLTFNLLWVWQLGTLVGQIYGAARLVIIYTVSACCGSLLTTIAGAYFTALPTKFQGSDLAIGSSTAIFGLCAALTVGGQLIGNTRVRNQYLAYAIAFFLFGLLMTGVDNWGHLGGFFGGLVICFLPWLDPRNECGKGHVWAGWACLVISFLSIALSFIDYQWGNL